MSAKYQQHPMEEKFRRDQEAMHKENARVRECFDAWMTQFDPDLVEAADEAVRMAFRAGYAQGKYDTQRAQEPRHCGTCGGTRKVDSGGQDGAGNWIERDCPECAQELAAGEAPASGVGMPHEERLVWAKWWEEKRAPSYTFGIDRESLGVARDASMAGWAARASLSARPQAPEPEQSPSSISDMIQNQQPLAPGMGIPPEQRFNLYTSDAQPPGAKEGPKPAERAARLTASYTTPYAMCPELAHMEVRDQAGDLVIDGDINLGHASTLAGIINAEAPKGLED
jgi:hypothetical protein